MGAFVVFAVVAAVTPGPSNIMLMAAGAQAGVVGGVPCLLGVATGMGVMMFVVPLGLGALVLTHRAVLAVLHWTGALFLLWLAWKIAASGRRVESASEGDPVGYLGALVFQWVNPKSWLVTASAAATFLGAGAADPITRAASLAGLFVVVALPSCFLWLALGATIQRALHDDRRWRVFNVTMGVLLAVSVVLVVR